MKRVILFLMMMVMGRMGYAAIALTNSAHIYDGASGDGVISQSYTHPAGTNTILAVAVMVFDLTDTDRAITSISYAGAALTCPISSNDDTGNITTYVCYKVNPATGANTFAIDMNGSIISDFGVMIYSFSGVDQSNPVDNSNHNEVTSGSPTVTVHDNYVGSMIVEAMYTLQSDEAKLTQGTNQNLGIKQNTGSETYGSTYILEATSGDKTIYWTDTNNDERTVSAVIAFRESASARRRIIMAE